jgi:hypothetical protein
METLSVNVEGLCTTVLPDNHFLCHLETVTVTSLFRGTEVRPKVPTSQKSNLVVVPISYTDGDSSMFCIPDVLYSILVNRLEIKSKIMREARH